MYTCPSDYQREPLQCKESDEAIRRHMVATDMLWLMLFSCLAVSSLQRQHSVGKLICTHAHISMSHVMPYQRGMSHMCLVSPRVCDWVLSHTHAGWTFSAESNGTQAHSEIVQQDLDLAIV